MATIEVSYEQFKVMASEFFNNTKGVTLEEAKNGHKCLVLAYLVMTDLDDLSSYNRSAVDIILELAGKRLLEIEFPTMYA
jgi:hypothetical protein